MVFVAESRRSVMTRLSADPHYVGVIEPVRNWRWPITIRIEHPDVADTVRRVGYLILEPEQSRLPVYLPAALQRRGDRAPTAASGSIASTSRDESAGRVCRSLAPTTGASQDIPPAALRGEFTLIVVASDHAGADSLAQGRLRTRPLLSPR